jgi:hypothetical protein
MITNIFATVHHEGIEMVSFCPSVLSYLQRLCGCIRVKYLNVPILGFGADISELRLLVDGCNCVTIRGPDDRQKACRRNARR